MRVVITGGTGLIGGHVCKALSIQGHEAVVARVGVTGPTVFSDCDAIIHLAGAPIFHRWTPSYKQLILKSRVKTAHTIYDILSKQTTKPKSFISASAVGFYGDRGEEILDETSSPGSDFLASTCVEWEKAREKFASLGMRTVSIRTATVLSQEGGALSKMLPIFRAGLGGKWGQGSQWFPWIHIDDLVKIYLQAIFDERVAGSVNAVAPGLIRNAEFVHTLGSILKRPTILSVPPFILKLALGERAAALLSSQRVLPRVLENLGFSFEYPTIQKALATVINKR